MSFITSAPGTLPAGFQNVVFQTQEVPPSSTQMSAYDPAMVGDTGSGGQAGNAPAPAAGDAAAGKFLKADGTWAVPAGGGDDSGVTSLNSLTGALEITAGSGISITPSGSSIQIASTGGGGGGVSGIPLFPSATANPTIAGTGLTTALNQSGTFSASNVANGIRVGDTTGTSGENIEGIVTAYPAAPFTAQAVFSVPQFSGGDYNLIGLCIANTLTGKLMVFGMRWDDRWGLTCLEYNSPSSFSGSVLLQGSEIMTPVVGFQLVDDGTNLTFSASPNGYDWTQVSAFAKASSFLGSSGFNYLGVILDTDGGPIGSTLLAWNVAG